MPVTLSINDLRSLARRRLPKIVFDVTGAGDTVVGVMAPVAAAVGLVTLSLATTSVSMNLVSEVFPTVPDVPTGLLSADLTHPMIVTLSAVPGLRS